MPLTVDKAITRATFAVSLPSLLLAGISLLLAFKLDYPLPVNIAVGVGGIIITWAYWSQAGTKWQIWAYTNVDAIHDLRDKALNSNVICDESSPWNAWVLRTPGDKQKLAALQSRFSKADTYYDSPAIPAETIIYFSKSANISTVILGIFFIGLGIYAMYYNSKYIIEGALVIAGGIYFFYRGFTRNKNSSPQIIINSKGIQTASIPFLDWGKIHNEQISLTASGGYGNAATTTAWLVYDYPGGHADINLDDMTIDSGALSDMLHVYRKRSGMAKTVVINHN